MPRSLLFSSDQETTRLLRQALHELEIEADDCPEIFAALQLLTSRIYDVIAVDWGEGLEAGFFLKTARELKSNRNAFVIVIAKADARADVRHLAANAVLNKPIIPAHAKYTLLTSDDFLSRMTKWPVASAGAQPAASLRTRTPLSNKTPSSNKKSAPTPLAAVTKPAATPPAANSPRAELPQPPKFATIEGGLLEEPMPRKLLRSALPAGLPRLSRGGNRLLRIAAMGVAFFAVGYVFSQPLTRAAASVVEISRGAWEKTESWSHKPQKAAHPAVELAQVDPPEFPQPTHEAAARIRVLPVRDRQVARFKPVSEKQAAVEPASGQDQSPESSSRASIPPSISAPFPGVGTVRDAAAKVKPALMDALEPVNLPGYLSDTLLVDRVEPSYPEQALRAGLQGPVVLHAWIGKDGRIRDLKMIRGSLLLGEAACKAVRQWRYKPYLLNGEAVEAQTYVTVDFKLP